MITNTYHLYADRADVTLTTFLWDAPVAQTDGGKRPLVLICPGGGYMYCSDREADPIALRFMAMGYHAAVLRYTTYGEGSRDCDRLDSDDPVKPHTLYPTQLIELGRAMLMIREHADAWRVDCERVALCGFSAGAHNCALYAATWNGPLIAGALAVEQNALRPAAVILGYPVVDFAITDGIDESAMQLHRRMRLAFLGAAEPTGAQFAEVNAACHVTESTPPMFIWHTAGDGCIPVRNSLDLSAALARARVPFELHVFERGGHGLALADQTTATEPNHLNPDAARWISLVEPWLLKRFALEVPGADKKEGQ